MWVHIWVTGTIHLAEGASQPSHLLQPFLPVLRCLTYRSQPCLCQGATRHHFRVDIHRDEASR